jgi:hypothetical protein
VNERSLSRKLSTSVVDALKAHGHILVVKGGATALARELDELMTPEVATIEPRLQPHAPLVSEPTSTFGDETVDQAVEDMVAKLTHALMNSDHVEDVFAEDAVIRRDIFRVVRDGLRERPEEAREEESAEASVTVKLDALGYVAATASRRAEASALRQALERAAAVVGARFTGFSPELREATFRLEGGGDDERLELEEAVADELTDLVEQGVIELPTIERRIDLGRAVPASEQKQIRGRIDAAAQATLLRSGCAASWEVTDPRTVRVLFTPLSEHDAKGVDAPTSAFARELVAILARKTAERARAAAAEPKPNHTAASEGHDAAYAPKSPLKAAPASSRSKVQPKEDEQETPAKAAPEPEAPAPKAKARKSVEPPLAKASTRAAPASKRRTEEPPSEKPAKKSATKKAAAKAKAVEAPARPAKPAKKTAKAGTKR